MWRVSVRLVIALALVAGSAAAGSEPARLVGRVAVEIEGVRLADAGRVVVFLEAIDAAAAGVLREGREVRQHGARFEPAFLAVSVEQPIEMPNDDLIYHNVFSYSAPNDFDLGLYAAGESRSVRFMHAGVVRFYCSIHQNMDGLIFVAPTRLFALPEADGRFAMEDVPPGRYRLRAWSERLPESSLELTLRAGEVASQDLRLGASVR